MSNEKMVETQGTLRVAAYARYSSDNQRDESIAAQFRAIHYFAEQKGYTIVAEYEDKALSGRTVHRPGFLAMMEAARQGNFDAIIMHKPFRVLV